MRFSLTIILSFFSFISYSQREIQGMGQWRYHIPYHEGVAITNAGEKVYFASSLGLFSYHKGTGELSTYTKVEGLNDVEIKTINYYEPLDILLIAYKNGNIDVIQNNTIINLGDIERKQIVGIKTINHIYFYNDFAYISCSFGIVIYDLKKLEVKDTYASLSKTGEPQQVFAATISNDSLFLATDIGVLSGSISENENLLDFNNWNHLSKSKSIKSIVNVNNQILALSNDSILVSRKGNNWDTITTYNAVQNIFEGENEVLIFVGDNLIVTDFTSENNIDISQIQFPIQAIKEEETYWICDAKNGLNKLNNGNLERFVPSGPISSSIFKINYSNDRIFLNRGGYGSTYKRQFSALIVDVLADEDWYSIGYWQDPILSGINDIVSTQSTSNGTIYMASHGFGLVKKDAENVFTHFDHTNSRIRTASQDDSDGLTRITDIILDENERLWMTNHNTTAGDSSIFMIDENEKWHSFVFPQISNSNFPERIIVDNDGNKWVTLSAATTGNGVMVFNEELEQQRLLLPGFEKGDLQDTKINDIAVDKDGAVWLVGRAGVSYYTNPSQIFDGGEENDATKPIFEGRPLLEEEFIKTIAIDGGNRKWFGSDNGLWLMDPTGTRVIKNFNTTNSPLPTNKINDIEINQKTGEVFIGTDLGLISYRSDATTGNNDCKNQAKVFPNPVEPNYSGEVGIIDLSDDAEIKITDAWGNLVYETKANGGAASWDLKDYNGQKASSGIYMILVNGQGRKKSCVTRLAIIN